VTALLVLALIAAAVYVMYRPHKPQIDFTPDFTREWWCEEPPYCTPDDPCGDNCGWV
jgi:hypothetical protein